MAIKSESFQMAIDLEKEGREYYLEHAQEADNPLSKTVLESLADRELEHIERIREIAGGKTLSEAELGQFDIEEKTREVFEDFSEAEREGWKSENTSVYEHALKLEEDLAELYKKMHNEADDEEEASFFQALMREEDKHFESIQNVVYFLTDRELWLSEEEGKVWGWMNT